MDLFLYGFFYKNIWITLGNSNKYIHKGNILGVGDTLQSVKGLGEMV